MQIGQTTRRWRKLSKIAVCVPFYPWYREHDRTNDIFEALIASMLKVKYYHLLSLSIVDCGIRDVWGRDRVHDADAFLERLSEEWPFELIYSFQDFFVDNRWHLARSVQHAVMQSAGEFIFLSGTDIILPKNFVEMYHSKVRKKREVWVPFAYNILRGAPWEIPKNPPVGFTWHTAKGIVGLSKDDFTTVGGYPMDRIKDHSDSDFYHRVKSRFHVNEEKCESMFHLAHPGSHASRIWDVSQL